VIEVTNTKEVYLFIFQMNLPKGLLNWALLSFSLLGLSAVHGKSISIILSQQRFTSQATYK